MTRDEIIAEIRKVPYWYHSIDVGEGVVTPGYIKNQHEWVERLRLPPSMKGLCVLDVGAWDGFYSFEAERRGAERVLATDSWVWERAYGMEGFLTARRLLNSKVEYMKIDPHEISKETVGEFDITFFLGVYYHLKDPLAVLERLAQVTRRQIIVESMVLCTPGKEGVPIARFVKGPEIGGDMSIWWVPNVECLIQTVEAAGFSRVDLVYSPIWYRNARSIVKRYLKDWLSPVLPPRMLYRDNRPGSSSRF
jgi:tRNA (mo5U34)-methyltransferase